MSRRVVVLGALSEIAEATARLLATEGASLLLAGRDAGRLDALAADLSVRGAAKVETAALDLAGCDPVPLLSEWSERLGGIDAVLVAYGKLGDQRALEADPAAARRFLDENLGSAAAWSLAAAERFAAAGSGVLLVIGSVAGDRGRQSNYVYGAAKGGLNLLTEGIAHRLAPTGARAVLVKPGLVDTAMTAAMPKGGPLWSSPERVAARIHRALGGSATTVYAPGWWRLVMAVIRSVPAPILHRTKL